MDTFGASCRYLVFDPEIDDWLSGRAFDPEFAAARPGGLVWATLASQARRSGWTPLTIDQYANLSAASSDAFLVVQLYRLSSLARELIESGRIRAAVAVCLESPLTAPDFYVSRGATVAEFQHVFAFPGALPKGFGGAGELHSLQWPYERPGKFESHPWGDRRLLTLIGSNRRSNLSMRPKPDAGGLLQYLRRSCRFELTSRKVQRALGRLPELYFKRLEMIEYFASHAEFDLYGFDWDKPVPGAERRFRASIDATYRGTIPHGRKIETLRGYRFAFCSENTVYPGYVTEKLLDCIVAGCVPLYLGAPDIERFVPAGAYVDVRKFQTNDELCVFLHEMSEPVAEAIRECGREFVMSSAFDSFDQANTARRIMTAVESSYLDARDVL